MVLFTNKDTYSGEITKIEFDKVDKDRERIYAIDDKKKLKICFRRIDSILYYFITNRLLVLALAVFVFGIFFYSFDIFSFIVLILFVSSVYLIKKAGRKEKYKKKLPKTVIKFFLFLFFFGLFFMGLSLYFELFNISFVFVNYLYYFSEVLIFAIILYQIASMVSNYNNIYILCNNYPSNNKKFGLLYLFLNPPKFVYWN